MKRIVKGFPLLRNYSEIVCVDAMYSMLPQYASSWLLLDNEDIIIIDTGTNTAIPNILKTIDETFHLTPDHVKYIIPTHVHLDHSGATSTLVNEICPNATVIGHPKTARFLHEHEGIVKGATAVYGEERFCELFGEITSVPKERIREVEDGECLRISEDRELEFLHTLGHSTHHMVVFDKKSNGVFTGDSFGMNYPQYGDNYFLPSTTPIDFDPHEAHKSIDLVMNTGADKAYLTHFDVWTDMERGAELNHFSLDLIYERLVKRVPELLEEYEDDEMKIREVLEGEMYIILEEILGMPRNMIELEVPLRADVFLNAWGSLVYVQRKLKKGEEII